MAYGSAGRIRCIAPPPRSTWYAFRPVRIVVSTEGAPFTRTLATARKLSGTAWDAGGRVARRRERAGIARSGVKVSLLRRARRRAVKASLAFRAVARLGIARAAAVLSRRAEVGRGVGAALGAEGSRVALRVAEGLTRVAGVPPRGAGQRRGADVASGAVKPRIAGGARVLPDARSRGGGVGPGGAGVEAPRDVLPVGAVIESGIGEVPRLARREVYCAGDIINAVS